MCVPTEQLADFEKKFEGMIYPHTESHSLTDNVQHGVNRKLVVR